MNPRSGARWLLAGMFISLITLGATRPLSSCAQPTRIAESLWWELIQGNQRFVTGKTRTLDPVAAREATAAEQHPRIVLVACSDNSMSPELIFDAGVGNLFVIRTAGNVADETTLASVEYAVGRLGARLLVVLGHEDCGAVLAALSGEDPGSPSLNAVATRIQLACADLPTRLPAGALARSRVARNVSRSATDLVETSAMLRAALCAGRLAVVRAVYDPESGEVTRLP